MRDRQHELSTESLIMTHRSLGASEQITPWPVSHLSLTVLKGPCQDGRHGGFAILWTWRSAADSGLQKYEGKIYLSSRWPTGASPREPRSGSISDKDSERKDACKKLSCLWGAHAWAKKQLSNLLCNNFTWSLKKNNIKDRVRGL